MKLVDGSTLELGEYGDRWFVRQPGGRITIGYRSPIRAVRRSVLRRLLDDAEERAIQVAPR